MSAFQPFLQHFAAGSDTASCQDYEEKEFVECFWEETQIRAVFSWLSKGIGFGFTTPFGWLVYLLWFWFYDSQVKTALSTYL